MQEDRLPLLVTDLIKELDATYKERCPFIGDSERMVWFRAGQRDVVNQLIKVQKRSDEGNVLRK